MGEQLSSSGPNFDKKKHLNPNVRTIIKFKT